MHSESPPPQSEVVVIGAGLAGLAAAVTLARAGVDVQLLETRERVGGRVWTLRDPFDDDLYAEAGAEFIAPGHLVLRHFLKRYGLTCTPRRPAVRLAFFRGRRELETSLGAFGPQVTRDAALLEQRVRGLAARVPNPARPWQVSDAAELDGLSVGDWLQQQQPHPVVLDHRAVWITIDYGVEPSRVSLLMYARDEQLIQRSPMADAEFVAGGMDQLPAAMARELQGRVHLGCTVQTMARDGTNIGVRFQRRSEDRSLTARSAVLALPFSVLRRLTVVPPFEPGRQRAIDGLRYSEVVKVHLQFRQRFWLEQGPVAGVVTDLPFQSAWDSTHSQPGERGILTVYTAGRQAEQLAALPLQARVRDCLEQLEQIFPGCSRLYERAASPTWSAEAASCGAYSFFGPGEVTAYGPWLARPAGRLHFAGEHADPWQATVNGALASGVRAAEEVLDQLRGTPGPELGQP